MTAEEFLELVRRSSIELDSLRAEYEHCAVIAYKVTAALDKVNVQTSNVNTSEIRFLNYADKCEELKRRVDKTASLIAQAERLIRRMENPRHRALIRYLYVLDYTKPKTAKRLRRSVPWIKITLPDALYDFQQVYDAWQEKQAQKKAGG